MLYFSKLEQQSQILMERVYDKEGTLLKSSDNEKGAGSWNC